MELVEASRYDNERVPTAGKARLDEPLLLFRQRGPLLALLRWLWGRAGEAVIGGEDGEAGVSPGDGHPHI